MQMAYTSQMSRSLVLDLEHLGQYTKDDRALEAEILELFQTQARTQLQEVCRSALEKDAKGWKFALHTLKGMARALGAHIVAEVAQKLEKFAPGEGNIRELEVALAALEREILKRKG
jgi:HPt (histidine-containing phosphotransfer) domain-containing protein